MTDEQIKAHLGVEETMQMLQVREQMKSQMSPEEYEQNMTFHKASIRTVIQMSPGITLMPIEAAERIIGMLDSDKTLDDDQREVWKAIVVIAAFEMQEF